MTYSSISKGWEGDLQLDFTRVRVTYKSILREWQGDLHLDLNP